EIVERNMGELLHSGVQAALLILLMQLGSRMGFKVKPEIRIRIHARRFRVADIAVWLEELPGEGIPPVPPFLAIEILSPDDCIVRMQTKVGEYLSIGVQWIWVIDPREKSALCYSRANPAGVAGDVLRTENPGIEIALSDVLNLAS